MKILKFIIPIFIFCSSVLFAEESSPKDTTAVEKVEFPDYSEPTKSPAGALVRSFVVPGWGQLYTERYWKAPLFFTAAATLGYFIYYNNSEYNKFYDLAKAVEDKNSTEYLKLKTSRDNFQNWRDQCGFYLLGVYAIAAVDAYTSAHLFDFNIDDDVSAVFRPYIGGVSLTIQF
jgi:hypothetical protein